MGCNGKYNTLTADVEVASAQLGAQRNGHREKLPTRREREVRRGRLPLRSELGGEGRRWDIVGRCEHGLPAALPLVRADEAVVPGGVEAIAVGGEHDASDARAVLAQLDNY